MFFFYYSTTFFHINFIRKKGNFMSRMTTLHKCLAVLWDMITFPSTKQLLFVSFHFPSKNEHSALVLTRPWDTQSFQGLWWHRYRQTSEAGYARHAGARHSDSSAIEFIHFNTKSFMSKKSRDQQQDFIWGLKLKHVWTFFCHLSFRHTRIHSWPYLLLNAMRIQWNIIFIWFVISKISSRFDIQYNDLNIWVAIDKTTEVISI